MGKTVFAGATQLQKLDAEHYGTFRPVFTRDDDGNEEHLRDLGPMAVLREARDDEDSLVVMMSFDPISKRPLKLVEVENFMVGSVPTVEGLRLLRQQKEGK